MAVGLLLITHDGIGRDLLATALSTLGSSPLETASLSVSQTDEPDALLARAMKLGDAMDDGDGVLVLTDMYGSTPSNVATRLVRERGWQLVAGVNLPMLIRVLNYPDLGIHELVTKALSGGHDGIMLCEDDD